MTANKELAAQAQAIVRSSEGLPRQAANCVMIALTYGTSVAAAREALGELERAALELLGELTAAEPVV